MRVSGRNLALGLWVVTERELAKFLRQRERLLSALVRPLLWLVVFASGLHDLLGVSIIPPYRTYTPYQEYILPGLLGMVVLFQAMQSALSLVYDREAGVMRVMLVSPLPRPWLLFAKIAAATVLAVAQCAAFLVVAAAFGIHLPWATLALVVPSLLLTGLMLGAIGLVVSVYTRQIENFAGMMNFVIFPMFFLSSALYPIQRMQDAGAEWIYRIAMFNPFTHAVEAMRHALYGEVAMLSLGVVIVSTIVFYLIAAAGYDPQRGLVRNARGG